MKKTLITSTLLLSLSFSIYASIPQQPMSPEKKSAMHKLDPVDIFPQVRERSGSERNRNNRATKSSTESASPQLTSNASEKETRSRSRKHSRGRHESVSTDLAANGTASPTPIIESSGATLEPTATVLPAATPDSSPALAETASKKIDPPPQTLAAMGNLQEDALGGQNKLLSLPIILALLVIVLIALVLLFAKLVRYLRGPAAQTSSRA